MDNMEENPEKSSAKQDLHAGDYDEQFETWCNLRKVQGNRVSVLTLYRMVAEPRGLEARELPLAERRALADRAMTVIWPGFEVVPGSDQRNEPIEIVPYSPGWPIQFQTWRARLIDSIGTTAKRIEHIGSTSVPGLASKPNIDIQVSVADLELEDSYVPHCEATGLQLRSRDAAHRYFRPSRGFAREVHLHVCEVGGTWEREHLLFRDFLRMHPEARDAYAAMKLQAALEWEDDRIGYTEAKGEVILDLLEQAQSWAESDDWTIM